MQPIHLASAVMLGIVMSQILSTSMSSSPSDCLPSVDICMSDLCKTQQAFYSGICEDEGCQMKGLEMCNLTIQTALDQFPSLRGCVCAWEGDLCGSMQMLTTQCHRKPGETQKRSTVKHWRSSKLIGSVHNGARSCLDQVTACISDTVCNRYLVPVLQACMAEQCESDRCQQETQQFYGSMPHNVAEMLVMCECEASDQSCVHMKAALHSGTCGDKTWICRDTVAQCAKDSNCRDILKTFQTKCWSSKETQCSDGDLRDDDCFSRMDPALILGADSECRMAFLATFGTPLHFPCSCKGVHIDELLTCNRIHDALHNRSHFMTSWKSNSGPSKPPKRDESEQDGTLSLDYLLFPVATVLLVGVVILMPLVVVSKIWMLRRRDETKCHHPQKSNCVVIL